MKKIGLIIGPVCLSTSVYAAHPLNTQDAGTVGKNTVELEMAIDVNHRKMAIEKEKSQGLNFHLGYGITDYLDFNIDLPYQAIKTSNDEENHNIHGASDINLGLKYKPAQTGVFSGAIAASVSLANGDVEKGLGTGKSNLDVNHIVSIACLKDIANVHFNAGFTYNRFKYQEDKESLRKTQSYVGLAVDYLLAKNWTAVMEVQTHQAEDKQNKKWEKIALLGGIYTIKDSINLSLGYQANLNDQHDHTLTTAITIKY